MFKQKKLIIVLSLVLVFALSVTAGAWWIFGGDKKDKTYTLKLGLVVNEDNPMTIGAKRLKERVEERTDGKLKIKVYPSGQLGGTKDVQEQAKAGANVAIITDSARLSEIVNEFGVLAGPYIAKNYDQVRKIVTSDLFKGWEKKLKDEGYTILSFNWYQGARHLLTKKGPIKEPADLNGMKIRTLGSPVGRKSIETMGGTPSSLAWQEVYPALQQGVLDGAEAQHPATYGSSLYEVINYITKTGHFQLVTGWVVGNKWFDKLPKEYQEILKEEALKAGDYASNITIERSQEYEDKMKEEGVKVDKIDLTAFKKATESVYKDLGYEELKAKIEEILAE